MSDTPPIIPTSPPVPVSERVKAFIADLARPFAIYVSSAAAAYATGSIAHHIAQKTDDFNAAAIYIGAVFFGVGVLYGAKALENHGKEKSAASVAIAEAQNRRAGDPPPNKD